MTASLLEQAQTLDQNVAFMGTESYNLSSRKQMRYEQRRSQHRRKRPTS